MSVKEACVILLHGEGGAGKDTVANYLVEKFSYKKMSFAAPLKKAVAELYGIPVEVFEDRILKETVVEEWGVSPRVMAQKEGDNAKAVTGMPDFFARRLCAPIEDGDHVVISDCRFEDEVYFIKSACSNVSVWKIDGADERVQSGMSEEAKSHPSERGLPRNLIDEVVDNTRSFEETFSQVDHLLFKV